MAEVFFRHPWHDPALPSRVYVAPDGAVRGFIGALPLRMSFHGRPVRAAVPSSLVVDRPQENPLAGAKLLRSFLAGPQEISISEPLNATSQAMWERLGGQAVPSESMEWLRVFHPAGLAHSLLGDESRLASLARPVRYLLDRLVAGTTRHALRPEIKPLGYAYDADASDDELLRYIPELSASYVLRPEWDPACLRWLLTHAGQNAGRGRFFRRTVFGKNNALLGCYLYHGRPGKLAWVLQILARPEAVAPVLDSLLAHAFLHGSVAVKGRTQLRLMDALLRRRCIFFRRHSAAVHSRNPELIAAVRSGDALTSGLAGESWTRLIGDTFD